MRKRPLISVIVPIYNVEKYLSKCIDSILNQTYTNLEIILVDDGSPDGSGKICDKYALMDTRIKVIHKKNGGLSSARNVGIDVANGEYIGFVDSDDFVEKYMYEKMLNSILLNNCLISTCNINYVFEDGVTIPRYKGKRDELFDFESAMREMNTYEKIDMGAWSKLYHKDLFNGIRFPEGKLSEDFYIMYRIFDKAQKVAFVSTPCYNYLQRKNSITKSSKINQDFAKAAYEQMIYLDEKYPNLSVIGHTSYASAVLTVYDFYLKNRVKCPKEHIISYRKVVKENLSYIKMANYLSTPKKIQIKLFSFSIILYNIVFLCFKKIRRV